MAGSCRSHHKPSGQAFVQFKRKRHYLGKHGSPESWEKYHRKLAESMAAQEGIIVEPVTPGDPRDTLSVNGLLVKFWKHAED